MFKHMSEGDKDNSISRVEDYDVFKLTVQGVFHTTIDVFLYANPLIDWVIKKEFPL